MIWASFFINPFFTFLYALYNYNQIYVKNILWAFTVFFSMTFSVGLETAGADINRYMFWVEQLHGQSMSFGDAIEYFKNSQEVDVARTFLSILVSRFTDNGYYLIIVFGIIYGYFFSRNIWFVYERLRGNKLRGIVILLITCLFLILPIWNINGFRFYTASQAFLYGLLPYLYDGEKRKLFWCFISPWLFHFAFLAPVLILLGYMVMGNRYNLYFIVFLGSFFIKELDISQFNQLVDNYLPKSFVERSEGYRDQEAISAFQERELLSTDKRWYAVLYNPALNWSLAAFLTVLYFRLRRILETNKKLLGVLSFTYLFFAVSNILSTLPSGGRFLSLASLLSLVILSIYLQNSVKDRLMERVIKVSYPALLLFIVVSIRVGFYSFSVTTVLGNPLFAIFTIGENLSLNDVLKSVF